jgi:transcriptional regulator with XRE-family HTH domain
MTSLSEVLQSTASSWPELDAVARRAGVQSRLASMARASKPINAGAYLALCAVTGLDPVDGKSRPVKELSPNVVWWFLSSALCITRSLKKLDQRGAAKVIGISPATVCRVERGQPVSIGVMLKVCAFIGVHPDGYTAPLNQDRLPARRRGISQCIKRARVALVARWSPRWRGMGCHQSDAGRQAPRKFQGESPHRLLV